MLLVTQHTGESPQHLDVFIRFGSNPYDEMRSFTRIPGHPRRHLHHRNPCLLDQVSIFWQPVGNRDAIAKIGVGHLFPLEHASNIARVNVPTIHQELTSLADSLLLIRRPGLHADQALINCDHHRLHRVQEGRVVLLIELSLFM